MDWIQIFALVVCATELVVIAIYYNDYGRPTGMYVSDILFQELPYKVVMTVFVAFQTLFSLMFALRLYPRTKVYFALMVASVVTSLAGWITLNTKYRVDGVVSDTHTFGTITFMAGTVAYSALLLFALRHRLLAIRQLGADSIISACVLILMVLCVVFGSVFMASLVSGEADSWLYEHSCFMTLVMAHLFFSTWSHRTPGNRSIARTDTASGTTPPPKSPTQKRSD